MYSLVKVGKNTYYMDGPYNVGIYKLSETEVCLIDSGINDHTVFKLDALLESLGWIPRVIINTHLHADHAGANRYLQKKYGSKIIATRSGAAILDNFYLSPMMIHAGRPPKELYNKFTIAQDATTSVITEKNLPKGLEVIELPGHAYEQIGIKTDDDVYFLADALVSKEIIDVHHIAFLYDVHDYLETLDYIKTLKGKLFIPAHSKALTDVTELVEYDKKSVLDNIKLILDICKVPKTTDEIIEAIFIHYDLKTGFYQYSVNGTVIRSYLSYLWDDGRLEVLEIGKKICFKKVEF